MTGQHRAIRDALGAYVVGALDPDGREVVEDHLADCSSCRDELALLAGIPPLLGRLDADEVDGLLVGDDGPVSDLFVARIARERRSLRRRVWAWRVAAAAAMLALVISLVPGPDPSSGSLSLAPVAMAADAERVRGSGTIDARPWGTAVALDLDGLPRRDRYLLVVTAVDGSREVAASWGPTATGRALLAGASSIDRGLVDHLAVEDAEGEALVAFGR